MATILQLVLNGTADGPVGVAVEMAGTAQRLLDAGLVARAGRKAQLRHRLVSLDGHAVRSGAQRRVDVDGACSLRGLGRGDVLVLPGLGMATPALITAGLQRPDVVKAKALVAQAHARGMVVAASCSATFVLAAAGILDGREATTTWWLAQTFARAFPNVALSTQRMVVRDGNVITAGSAFAHADLMLAILAQTCGPSLAHAVARYLVLDARDSQARYMVMDHAFRNDPVVRRLERFVLANLRRQVTLQELARATATSPRTLARKVFAALGTTPQRFVQRLRVAQAVHLLETTQRPMDQVAADVGYADAAAFRRVFRRETGESPRERRSKPR